MWSWRRLGKGQDFEFKSIFHSRLPSMSTVPTPATATFSFITPERAACLAEWQVGCAAITVFGSMFLLIGSGVVTLFGLFLWALLDLVARRDWQAFVSWQFWLCWVVALVLCACAFLSVAACFQIFYWLEDRAKQPAPQKWISWSSQK